MFNQNLDRNYKIYIPKLLRDAGFYGTVTIRLNDVAAVMHPVHADLSDVKASVKLILKEIERQRRRQKVGQEIEQ